ncbi:alpha/beta hydrolase [Falsarthrobacter nasiphocae]|uniref:Acetyl esterase/lipase n=1 Tax=Falsarthrobacter nasiphocae TaxID=189863 RepID=A0AAE3YFY2_9MICC|nr:alpha/beta hydrolase [Falsarthrobacter nasiphocae]MDR6891208.1 acetyl esterase/lipase [Falsarthrobacter nasiphocae]
MTQSEHGLRPKRPVPRPVVYAGMAAGAWSSLKVAGLIRARREAAIAVRPELRHWRNYLPLSPRGPVSLGLVRRFLTNETAPLDGVRTESVQVSHPAAEQFVPAFLYTPSNRHSNGALLWIHGGGTISGTAAVEHATAAGLASRLGVPVLNVDYRLAPEHPFPLPFEDCWAGLVWLHANAERLGVDPQRIAVGGTSAGGLLAAALAQKATDERVPVCFQALLAPMLDDRTSMYGTHGLGRVGWDAPANRFAWAAYRRREAAAAESRPYAVPARRNRLTGLPPAWIAIGDIDLFYPEDVDYAERLQEDGVACELVVVEGMYHGAEDRCPDAPAIRRLRASMDAALTKAFSA